MTNIHSEALNSPCQLYIVLLSIRGIQQLTWFNVRYGHIPMVYGL